MNHPRALGHPTWRRLVLAAALLAALAVAAAADDGTVLVTSDVHFNPFFDPDLVPQLVEAEVSQWDEIFAGSTVKGLGSYGHDSNYHLFASALEHMKRVVPAPDFIIFPGDFLSHHFHEEFKKYAGTTDPEALHAFIMKTVAFVTAGFTERYPDTAIYPAVGNNDTYCGDYMTEPAGGFLKVAASAWKDLFKDPANAQSFLRTFPAGGYYSVTRPGGGHRIIVLNSIFWSRKYKNQCGQGDADPGQAEMQWLANELAVAASRGELVWLVCHLPPGISAFSTVRRAGGGKITEPVFFWQSAYNETFLGLIRQHASTVVVAFAGHTHMDNFELLGQEAGKGAGTLLHIVPAISPVFGNNPGFQVFSYDRQAFRPLDYRTEYVDLAAPAGAEWQHEYSFTAAYAQPGVDPASLQAVYYLLLGSPGEYLEKYARYYDVSNLSQDSVNQSNLPAYWSAIGQMESSGFLAWYGALTASPASSDQSEDP